MAKIIVDVPDDVLNVLDEAAKAAGHSDTTALLQHIVDARVFHAKVAKGLAMAPVDAVQDLRQQLDTMRRTMITPGGPK